MRVGFLPSQPRFEQIEATFAFKTSSRGSSPRVMAIMKIID